MKIGTLTFHGAHNYGSMLQAYALQRALSYRGAECEIVNYRSTAQRRMYRVFSLRPGIGPILKDLSHIPFYFSLKKKYQLFEDFIRYWLNTSEREYHSIEELKTITNEYDALVCGSDQIWKTGIQDFSLAYLLPFSQSKKVSYAASFGPISSFSLSYETEFRNYLGAFSAISVREESSKKKLEEILENVDVNVVCDPVFLLNRRQWLELIGDQPIINGDYIFFYTLFANTHMIKMVRYLAKKYKMKVVISNYSNFYDLFSGFERHLETGPCEFLNLIYNARYVCTSSFHATAFSLILNKQLFSLSGMSDNRISFLLKMFHIEFCSVTSVSDIDHLGNSPIQNYSMINRLMDDYSSTSWNFIENKILH